jgi:RHS repeat-associated protein
MSNANNNSFSLVSKDALPAASAGWTIEGSIWNVNSHATSFGNNIMMGALPGSPTQPTIYGPPQAGIILNGGTDPNTLGTNCVWPGGSYHLGGTNGAGSYYAVSWDGTTVRCYVDGTLVHTQAANAPLASGPAGFQDNSYALTAQVDELRISNSARYVGATMPVPTSKFTPDANTLALYHFDDYKVGRLPSVTITPPSAWTIGVPGLFGDSTAAAHDLNEWTTGGCYLGCTTETVQPYTVSPGMTLAEILGAGLPWICPCTRHTTLPVNTLTGEFWHTFDDLTIPGRGIPIDLQRTYSSSGGQTLGPFGYGWTNSYQMHLQFGSGSPPSPITVVAGNGSSTQFTWTGSTYVGDTEVLASFAKVGSRTYTLTDKSKTVYAFDAGTGNLTSETDRNGYVTSLGYTSGKLTSVTAPGGMSLTFSYDPTYTTLIHSATDSAGRVFTYAYDANSNLISVSDAGHKTQSGVVAGVTTYAYDSTHRMTTMQDPNCTATPANCAYTPRLDTGLGTVHGVTNIYDSSNRVIRQYDDRGVVTEFSYAGDGDPYVPTNTTTIKEHPTPSTSVQTVDSYTNGLLMSETKAYGTSQAATWQYAYDPVSFGQIMTVDPSGRATITTRDALANPLTITDPAGGVETLTYTTDGFNNVATDQDPVQAGASIKTTYTYDTHGNLNQVSRPLDSPAGTLNVSFNRTDSTHPDDVITKTDGDGKVWSYSHDAAKGYLLTATDPVSSLDVTHYGYDAAGRQICKVVARGNTTCPNTPIGTFETQYSYDPSGELVDTLAPLGHHSTALFDLDGNRTSATDADGNITGNAYDAVDRLTQVNHPDSTFDTTSYDDLGNVLEQTTANASATFFKFDYTYDNLNHLTGATDNANPRRTTSYSYDAQDELVSVTDPQSQVTTNAYDGAGRLARVAYSDGVTPPISYTYDADGQRLSMVDGTGSSSYSWDSLHRMKQTTNGAGSAVGYVYDYRNDATTITYPGAIGSVQRQFDPAGRLSHVQDWLGNGITFAYDVDGNLKSSAFPNGVIATNTYDNADQSQQIADTGAGALFNLSYTSTPRDQLGQLKSDGSTTYGYDNRNRLTTINGASNSWTFDPANDVTKTPNASSMTYDGANQLQSMVSGAGTTTFGFDSRGNRTTQTPPSGPATTYGYDQANRLTSYNQSATYGYNGDGLRMTKNVTATATQFTYDTSGGLPVIIQAGATTNGTTSTTSYLTGPRGLPVEQIAPGSTVGFFHQDQLGSTARMSGSADTLVGSYSYTPFGVITVNSGTAPVFGFAGQYADAESGLVYLRARYYDPSTGQFISRDPLVAVTRAPYAYVADNPLNAIDPSGLDFLGIGNAINTLINKPAVAAKAASIAAAVASGLALVSLASVEVTGPVGLAAAGYFEGVAELSTGIAAVEDYRSGNSAGLLLDLFGLQTGGFGMWFKEGNLIGKLGMDFASGALGGWATQTSPGSNIRPAPTPCPVPMGPPAPSATGYP